MPRNSHVPSTCLPFKLPRENPSRHPSRSTSLPPSVPAPPVPPVDPPAPPEPPVPDPLGLPRPSSSLHPAAMLAISPRLIAVRCSIAVFMCKYLPGAFGAIQNRDVLASLRKRSYSVRCERAIGTRARATPDAYYSRKIANPHAIAARRPTP